jgi:hypothetical protein
MLKLLAGVFGFAGLALTAAATDALAQSQQCQSAMAQWQQAVASHNARCGNVQFSQGVPRHSNARPNISSLWRRGRIAKSMRD